MFLIDTSVWINIFRDKTGKNRQKLTEILGENPFFLSRFTQMELLQGSKNEREWSLLSTYLQDQDYLEFTNNMWLLSARIYYDLRRQGLTVRSSIDCCIAQLAISYQLILIHNDRDFTTISQIRPLNCLLFSP